MTMPRPVSVSSAYELFLAKQERRDARPEYVLKNAELVPAEGDDAGSRKNITTPATRSRRVHEPDDEHALIDEVAPWDGV